jgi:hypothetical protein
MLIPQLSGLQQECFGLWTSINVSMEPFRAFFVGITSAYNGICNAEFFIGAYFQST